MSGGRGLRLAAVGTGFFSRFHYNAWRRMAEIGDVEPVAICSLSPEIAHSFSELYGFDSVYDDFESMLDRESIDLVDIITPPGTHDAFVRAAVDRGIDVICQKPFTTDLDTARALIRYIEAKQGRVFIHENFRFQPWYRQIKSMLDNGDLGDPLQISFHLRPGDGQGADAYLERQPYFQQMPRFLVHETAIHFIDTFRFLFGEIVSVYAQLDKLNPVIAGEDTGLIIFQFENGCRGLFDGNRLVDHAADDCRLTMGEMRIEGTQAVLDLNGFANLWIRQHGKSATERVLYPWNNNDFGGDCVFATNKHLVDRIAAGGSPVNSASDYLVNLEIEAAIYRSAESGNKISL